MTPDSLFAGAAVADITPDRSEFLFGYPHVERYSTGVHDPLLASALYLSDGHTPILLISCDVIFVTRPLVEEVRRRIEDDTGVPGANILVAATHTHSGPITADMLSNEADPVVPKADRWYLGRLEDSIVEAATKAHWHARPAKAGLAVADGSCVGSNRHDRHGPSDPQVPVLVAKDVDTDRYLALMAVCSMHPTVLHEESRLVSADFPWAARQYVQQHVVGKDCPVVYFTGPCGDQSPRHVAQANTFDEAERLGTLLGRSIADAVAKIQFRSEAPIACARAFADLPLRSFPTVKDAERQSSQAAWQFEALRADGAPRAQVRTAECDWFGAQEELVLAKAAAAGRVDAVAASVLPAEIMCLNLGPWTFVGWSGEAYVEFALAVKRKAPDTFVISLANGELQGYVATEQAVIERRYEALNALFEGPCSGEILVAKTLELVDVMRASHPRGSIVL